MGGRANGGLRCGFVCFGRFFFHLLPSIQGVEGVGAAEVEQLERGASKAGFQRIPCSTTKRFHEKRQNIYIIFYTFMPLQYRMPLQRILKRTSHHFFEVQFPWMKWVPRLISACSDNGFFVGRMFLQFTNFVWKRLDCP